MPDTSSPPTIAALPPEPAGTIGPAPVRQAAAPSRSVSQRRGRGDKSALATPVMLAGLAIALVTQYAIFRGAEAFEAELGFLAAVVVFVFGLLNAADTGLLTWAGPLARRPRRGAVRAVISRGGSAAASPGARAPARRQGRSPGISQPVFVFALTLGAGTFVASGGNQFRLLNVITWVASVALAFAACWERSPGGPGGPGGSMLPLPKQWDAWLGSRLLGFGSRRRRNATPAPAAGPRVSDTAVIIQANGAAAPSLPDDQAASRFPGTLTLRIPWTAVALAIILIFGAFLLYYRIYDVPRDMTSDHAEKLLDVQDVLDGQHHIFFPRNTGREAIQFYLIAVMSHLTGVTYLTMKLGTALMSFLALPFTFFLARVFFPTPFALLATGIMAMTRWHLQVARVGLRFPFPPLFGAAIFLFLLKAVRDRRRNDFLLCGFMLGLGQHSYTALRIAPLGVVGCLSIALLVDIWRREPVARVHRLVVDSLLLIVVAVLVFMPLGRYAFDQPEMFLFRGVSRIASESGTDVPPNVLGVFLHNVANALLFFNWRGDLVWVNTVPLIPTLDPVSGALFVLGCAYAIYRLLRFRELPYLYLLVLLFVGLLPSILTLAFPQENPSTVRMGMAIPITAVLVTLPLYLLLRRVVGWIGGTRGRVVGGAALAVALVLIFQDNFYKYYVVYPAQHARNSQHTSAVGAVVNGFVAMGGRRDDVHIFPGAYWIDTRLVAIEAGSVRWDPLIGGVQDVRAQDGVDRPRLYIIKPDDRPTLDTMRRWYPDAITQSHALPEADNQPWFVTVLVPPGVSASA